MTDYESVARQRLGLVTVQRPVSQAVRIWWRFKFAGQLIAVVLGVWLVAAAVLSLA